MSFSISKFFSGYKSSNSSTKGDTSPSSAGSPTNSRAGSIFSEFAPSSSNDRYLHDPMRNNKHADTIGNFVDPMSIQRHGHMVTMHYDVTNTGA